MIGDSRDGGGRPPVHLVATGFSKQGYGHVLGLPISAWEVVPPGFPWLQHAGGRGTGVNHDNSTTRGTEGAELGPPNSASGGRHYANVRATRNGCVKPPD